MKQTHVIVLKVTSHFVGEGKTIEDALASAKRQLAESLVGTYHADRDGAKIASHQIRQERVGTN